MRSASLGIEPRGRNRSARNAKLCMELNIITQQLRARSPAFAFPSIKRSSSSYSLFAFATINELVDSLRKML
jgi:hypothetical protein